MERNDKYSVAGDIVTRIGAPISSDREGSAHPRGRFDVQTPRSGNGMDTINANSAMLLSRCKTRDEALKFFTKEFVDVNFDTRDSVNDTLNK